MATEDHIMTDIVYPELSVSGRTQMEALRESVEDKLQEIIQINKSIERGMENMRIEVSSQIQTIHVSVDGHSTRTSSGSRGILSRLMPGSENTNPFEEDTEDWKKKNLKSKEDYRILETEKVQDTKTIQDLRSQLKRVEEDHRETRMQLENMGIKNRQLQEQTQIFRGMIINRGSSNDDVVDDNTIIKDFVALRDQIQRIVNRYYKCEARPPTT